MMEVKKHAVDFDLTVRPAGRHLDHEAVAHIEAALSNEPLACLIEVDLSEIQAADTSGFAALVVMRKRLLRSGSDMRISGLHGKAFDLYRFIRLHQVLPIVWQMDDACY